ncbi:LysR substrate-binding domain-containing protein [Chromatiaceae bacterium AAb-1]|nr:LysR substrate-binding domain-containing protein [Chromatiaceae bacterium AAb-1]
MIELKHLRTMQALSDTGSLQAAADLLCVTQSALSHQLKDLEHRLGAVLFERKTVPVQFSAQGRLLLELAEKVLPEVDAANRQLKLGADTETCLRLCVECHACFHWLLPAVRHFCQDWPAIKIDFTPFIEHNAIEALLQHELDIVLTSDLRLPEQVAYRHLFDMELRLLVSPEHPLARRSQVEPEDLVHQTIFSYPIAKARQDLFRYFLPESRFKGKNRQIEQGSQIVQLVAANEGVAALPSWMAEPYQQQGLLCSVPLGTAGLWRPMYLACRKADAGLESYRALSDSIQLCKPVA